MSCADEKGRTWIKLITVFHSYLGIYMKCDLYTHGKTTSWKGVRFFFLSTEMKGAPCRLMTILVNKRNHYEQLEERPTLITQPTLLW